MSAGATGTEKRDTFLPFIIKMLSLNLTHLGVFSASFCRLRKVSLSLLHLGKLCLK